MKHIFSLLIFLFLTFHVKGQSYYEHVAEAESLYHASAYEEAVQEWERAFSFQEGFASDHYNAACTYALAGKKEMALTHLRNSILKGWTNIDWMKKDSDLQSLHGSDEWENLIDDIPSL